MQADIAVEPDKMRELFPFSRLTDAANVLVFPSLAAGNAAYKVLAALGGATAIGPILLGVNKPVTVLPRDANVDTIVSMTAYRPRVGGAAGGGFLGEGPPPFLGGVATTIPGCRRSAFPRTPVGRSFARP